MQENSRPVIHIVSMIMLVIILICRLVELVGQGIFYINILSLAGWVYLFCLFVFCIAPADSSIDTMVWVFFAVGIVLMVLQLFGGMLMDFLSMLMMGSYHAGAEFAIWFFTVMANFVIGIEILFQRS